MSLVDLALLPIRVGLGIADAVLHMVVPDRQRRRRSCSSSTACPKACPPRRCGPSPRFRHRPDWPFGEEFPRTCGTSRFAGGALFWTDFLYDDHGATASR